MVSYCQKNKLKLVVYGLSLSTYLVAQHKEEKEQI